MLGLSTVSCDNTMIVHLGQKYQRPNVPMCDLGYVETTGLITGHGNLGRLGEVVSAGFLHSKVTIFPFLINK